MQNSIVFLKKVVNIIAVLLLITAQSMSQKADVFVPVRHSGFINSIEILPGERYFLTSGQDATLKLYDLKFNTEIRTFKGHTGQISNVSISKDGKKAFSAAKDGEVCRWNIETGELELKKKLGKDALVSVAVSPADNSVCVVSTNDIFVLDPENFTIKNKIQVIAKQVYFNPDGAIAYFLDDYSCYAYTVSGAKVGQTLKVYYGTKFRCMATSPDGKVVAMGGNNGYVFLYNGYNGYGGPGGDIGNFLSNVLMAEVISFSTDGKFLAVAGNGVEIYDLETKTLQSKFRAGDYNISSVRFVNKNKSLLVGSLRETNMYDIQSGQLITSFGKSTSNINDFCLTPDEQKLFYCDSTKYIKEWDLRKYRMSRNWIGDNYVTHAVTAPDNKTLLSFALYSQSKWNINNGSILKQNKLTEGYDERYSYDGKYLLRSVFEPSKYSLYTTDNLKLYKRINLESPYMRWASFSENSKYVAVSATSPDAFYVFDIPQKKTYPIAKFNNSEAPESASFLHDNSTVAVSTSFFEGPYFIKFYSLPDGKNLRSFEVPSNITNMKYSLDGKHLFTINESGLLQKINTETGFVELTLNDNSGIVTNLLFANNGNRIYTGGADGTIKIWNSVSGKLEAQLVSDMTDWIIFTPDGYFDGSPNCGHLVNVSQGLNAFNIDQFALQFNRPDKILQVLNGSEEELIAHFYQQYKKRLRKLSILEEQLSATLHVPEVEIIDYKQNDSQIDISFRVSDSKLNLRSYNVYINDVPLYGAGGKKLAGKIQELNEKLELNNGTNKIEISCLNEKGAESYRASLKANCQKQSSKNIYLLAFGVSKYQNSAYNLAYADKDAIDLSKVIETYKGKGFENVYTKVLTNEQVTPEAIKASKDFVKNAKPDDTFILFIAGHGMHDKDAEATYYFLTSNADINNLKATAADFETIEDLLQGIPPRNKLFLMDACESGEIDEEELETLQGFKTLEGLGIASRGFKATSSPSTVNSQPSTKRSYLYQKDRYIYNDLVRRSGAIVFSSSKGGELSYERSDIENGLFTEYIMKALTTTEADKDGNGTVSTDELRQYVSEQVAKASGDLQHPTVDRDNIYQKFGFGVR